MSTTDSGSSPQSLALMISHGFDQIHSAPWWIWAVIAFFIVVFVVRKGTNRVRAV